MIESKKIYIFSLASILFVYFFPDIYNSLARHGVKYNNLYIPNFDTDVSLTWSYMIFNGMIPIKDFWYPYSGSYIFDLPSPIGEFILFLYLCFIFSILFYLLYKIFDLLDYDKNSTLFLSFVTTLIIILGSLTFIKPIFPQPERHLLPFLFVFSYFVNINKQDKFSIILFWLIALVLIFFEVSQLLYCLPSVIFLIIYDRFFLKNPYKAILKNNVILSSIPILFTLIILLIFYKHNLLDKLLMIFDGSAITHYMAMPYSFKLGSGNILTEKAFFILFPFLIFSTGLFFITHQKKSLNFLPPLIVCCGLIGLFNLYKHGIRPIDWAIFYSIFFGVFLICLHIDRMMLSIKQNRIYKLLQIPISSFLFLSFLFFHFISGSVLDYSLGKIMSLKSRVNSALSPVFFDVNNNLDVPSKFDDRKLVNYKESIKFVKSFKAYTNSNNLLVLTDDPVIYPLMKIKPPYQINGFSLSPFSEQKLYIDQWENKKWDYVVINKNKLFIDGFSYIVRLPLVYSYLLSNYSPEIEFDDYFLFKRDDGKVSKNRNNINFYSKLFGNNIYFSHSFLNSSKSLNDLCEDYEKNCGKYIHVILNNNNNNKVISDKIEISVLLRNEIYSIFFNTNNNKLDYYIPINNIWFLNYKDIDLIKSENIEMSIVSLKNYPSFY